jgi:hypothetical protein
MNMNQPTFIALCLAWAVAFAPAQDAPPPARPQYSPEQILKFWDKNGDGKLTPDEVPNASLFKLLDKNGDGVVTKDEAAAIGTWGAGKPGAKPAGQGAGAVRGSPDPAPGMTDRSPASGRPAVGVSGEVGRPAPSAEDGAAADGGRGITSLFKQRDRNGDGKLDRSELPGAWSVLSAGETGRRMVN